MMKKNKHIVVIMRHGERSDFKGLTPKFGANDPELTKHGEEQAVIAGKMISKQLEELKIDKDNSKIQIYSSPFVRTLQTSRGVLKGIKTANVFTISDTINVDCNLCEHINYEFDDYPKNFLNILHKTQIFTNEFSNDKLNLVSTFDILPNRTESDSACTQRFTKYFNWKIPELLKSEFNITILVSHATPVSEMNMLLNYPSHTGWWDVSYCQSFYYEISPDTKESKYITKVIPPQ